VDRLPAFPSPHRYSISQSADGSIEYIGRVGFGLFPVSSRDYLKGAATMHVGARKLKTVPTASCDEFRRVVERQGSRVQEITVD
jgi:hypothetical protein